MRSFLRLLGPYDQIRRSNIFSMGSIGLSKAHQPQRYASQIIACFWCIAAQGKIEPIKILSFYLMVGLNFTFCGAFCTTSVVHSTPNLSTFIWGSNQAISFVPDFLANFTFIKIDGIFYSFLLIHSWAKYFWKYFCALIVSCASCGITPGFPLSFHSSGVHFLCRVVPYQASFFSPTVLLW